MPDPTASSSSRSVAVIMERVTLTNRWIEAEWSARAVLADDAPAGTPHRVIVDHAGTLQILFPAQRVVLRPDEAEGYYLNVTAPHPRVFVMWRMRDGIARPEMLSVSYHEGARWMDSDERVDGVPLPADLAPWVAEYVERHYRPEPPKAKRYASNKDRGRMGRF